MRPKNQNHSTSKHYEILVQGMIEQEMSAMSGIDLLEIQHSAKMKGLSGYEHQVDIAYRFRIWKTEILVIVECKQYSSKVGVGELLEFRSRIDDLRAHKGIFVTTVGYQSGALEFAEANRIALLVARGTQCLDIQYCLSPISQQGRAKAFLQQLRSAFETSDNDLDSRLKIDESKLMVVVHHKDTKVILSPGELQLSMLYRHECQFEDSDTEEFFFHGGKFGFLRPQKVFVAVVLDLLLAPNFSSEQDASASCRPLSNRVVEVNKNVAPPENTH